jgi:CDP-glycerol glycerophosphotransferase (TagB/SpsB family)
MLLLAVAATYNVLLIHTWKCINTHCCWETADGVEEVAQMQSMVEVLTDSWEVMMLVFGTAGQMS